MIDKTTLIPTPFVQIQEGDNIVILQSTQNWIELPIVKYPKFQGPLKVCNASKQEASGTTTISVLKGDPTVWSGLGYGLHSHLTIVAKITEQDFLSYKNSLRPEWSTPKTLFVSQGGVSHWIWMRDSCGVWREVNRDRKLDKIVEEQPKWDKLLKEDVKNGLRYILSREDLAKFFNVSVLEPICLTYHYETIIAETLTMMV
jgi:hypothetical protein